MKIMTRLILNDMVKVKGQISEMATCLEDDDPRIAELAKSFFSELSKKVQDGSWLFPTCLFLDILISLHIPFGLSIPSSVPFYLQHHDVSDWFSSISSYYLSISYLIASSSLQCLPLHII